MDMAHGRVDGSTDLQQMARERWTIPARLDQAVSLRIIALIISTLLSCSFA